MKASDPSFSQVQPPLHLEEMRAYCARLEALGYEESVIRKGLASHFGLPVSEMSEWFESFPKARLRHIELLVELAPNRTEYSLIVKVAKNLGVSRASAARWVEAFKKA
ncbi:hypothetical protein [Terricaulis sp.]|uniref:hypothetical protein n=1 Tax=Terricaulis sp. TaxID=2768686 RepID=UPI002AC7A312|nr:hypothetical protein [Terricaulis sp.]MDZ4692626.1 hypothetical protein [Terricaulis sp.]